MAKKKHLIQPADIAPPMSSEIPFHHRYRTHLTLGAILLAVTFAVFQVISDFDLLSFGDREAIMYGASGNWIPVTWTSHRLDTVFGWPRHVTNLMLHWLSSGLFFAALCLLTSSPGRSFAAAVFFAVHPLRAQSVAWVAERQGLLAGFFSFLTLAAWALWKRGESRWAYAVAVAGYVLAVMSSPSALVLPAVLFLLEFWPRKSGKWDAREKSPFMAIGVIGLAVWFARVSAVNDGNWRLAESVWPALFHTFWPVDLTPISGAGAPGYGWLAGWISLMVLGGAVVIFADRFRFLLTGLIWFVVALAGSVAWSELAWHSYSDRFTYFAHAGLGLALVWLGHALLGARATYVAIPLALLMAWQCRVQLSFWKDDDTLVARAVDLNSDNPNALLLLGNSYLQRRNVGKGIEVFRRAVALAPRSAETRLQLAGALQAANDKEAALVEIDRAIKLEPKQGSGYFHRGSVLMAMERPDEARPAFLRALAEGVSVQLRQGALLSLGLIETSAGEFDPALKYFSLVLEGEADNYQARKTMGLIYLRQSKWQDSLRELERLGSAGARDEEVRQALATLRERVK